MTARDRDRIQDHLDEGWQGYCTGCGSDLRTRDTPYGERAYWSDGTCFCAVCFACNR
jgi:hypothetical protein